MNVVITEMIIDHCWNILVRFICPLYDEDIGKEIAEISGPFFIEIVPALVTTQAAPSTR